MWSLLLGVGSRVVMHVCGCVCVSEELLCEEWESGGRKRGVIILEVVMEGYFQRHF